jgi:hypothetical protein
MFRKMLAGSTSESIPVLLTNSTTGAGYGGLLFSTIGLAAGYRRQGQSTWTSISLVTMTLGTWVSGGFIVDNPNNPASYELGMPNLAIAAGVEWVQIGVWGATGLAPYQAFFELDAINYQLVSQGLVITKTTNITGFNDIAATAIVSSAAIATDGSGRVTLAPAGLDSITIEAGINPRQALAVIGSAVAGVGGPTTGTYVGMNNSTVRIGFSDNSAGQRTAVTCTPPT